MAIAYHLIRGESKEQMRTVATILFIACLVLGHSAFADSSLAEARAKITNYEKSLLKASQAMAKQDAEEYQKYNKEAARFLEEGREAFDALVDLKSRDAELLSEYAQVLGHSQDFDLAVEALRRVVEIKPQDTDALLALCRVLMRMGASSAADAEEAVRRALDVLAESGETLHEAVTLLGDLQSSGGAYDLARKNYAKAIEANPGFPAASIGLAALEIREGKLAEGLTRVESLGALSPELSQRMSAVIAGSLSDFERRRRSMQDTPENHYAYAKLLFQAGRADESLFAALHSVKMKNDDHQVWNFIGSVSRILGNSQQAKKAFERSLELEPEQPRTISVLNELNTEQ